MGKRYFKREILVVDILIRFMVEVKLLSKDVEEGREYGKIGLKYCIIMFWLVCFRDGMLFIKKL